MPVSPLHGDGLAAVRAGCLASARRTTERARKLARVGFRVERPDRGQLLGGDEPVDATSKKRKRRDPKKVMEHDAANKSPTPTCVADRASRGAPVLLRPTGDPFDRAHSIRVAGMLKAAATGGKRLRPITPAAFEAAARLYPEALLKRVRILIYAQDRDGAKVLTRASIDVGPDSQVELSHAAAERVQEETGVNLFGGNMAAAVHAVLNRGGDEFVKNRNRRIGDE